MRAYGYTVLWLVAALVVALIAYISNLAVSGLFGVCGYQNPRCDYGLVDFAYRFGAYGITSVAVLTTLVTLLSIAARRPMRRIPITGIVLICAVAAAAFVMTLVSIG
ncbi:hypothetical protein BFL36_06975 [Clavibacter michiganensis]|uniref:Uncharacterized protein n=1 Tax=Clavibacter michiganensis TaxID=28447 RepID=A0A251YIK8_9MICO|nr:hypothetical protein BFL36_06975 [Clavibacter michiganensis]